MATVIKPLKLKAEVRMKVNDALFDMCKRRHRAIPMADFSALLAKYGLKIEEVLLMGTNSNAQIDVLTMDGKIVESWFCLSWLKGDHDGQWEVNAYLS